ncbi:Arm DNA-binding domain-containing protein [Variovorax terrae]|uniref:Arm DNA-binding domain-containing protein n=1 Tax=Variovorax terrae TaxID=2923278 RepID=A0A9X2AQ93_9BURK|nr:Arm DNA-binding domain-containing protein [Variovorax terrae]
MGRLNDLKIKSAKPRDKEYLLADGEGLYLRVRPTGKAWAFRYRSSTDEVKLSLGAYPTVSLAEARTKARIEAGKLAAGIDVRHQSKILLHVIRSGFLHQVRRHLPDSIRDALHDAGAAQRFEPAHVRIDSGLWVAVVGVL